MKHDVHMNVHLDMWSDGVGLNNDQVDLLLTGTSDEKFVAVLDRAYAATRGRTIRQWWGRRKMPITFWWREDSDDPDLSTLIEGGADLTLGEIDRFFGDLGRAEPPVVFVDTTTGRGGGEEVIPDLIALLRGSAEVYGIFGAFVAARHALVRTRHRKSREAVVRWEHSAIIDAELEQLVKAQSWWTDRAFSKQFGLAGVDSGRLLRALSYTWNADSAAWVEVTEIG